MLCAPTTAQWAGVAALETGFADDFADTRAMIDEYAVRRRFIIDAFNDMGLSCNEPEGAFYVFPSIRSTGLTSEQFCDGLLASKKIVTVPGSAFGAAGEGHIRCCYATSMQDIETAMRRCGVPNGNPLTNPKPRPVRTIRTGLLFAKTRISEII
jgi:aminotransferase